MLVQQIQELKTFKPFLLLTLFYVYQSQLMLRTSFSLQIYSVLEFFHFKTLCVMPILLAFAFLQGREYFIHLLHFTQPHYYVLVGPEYNHNLMIHLTTSKDEQEMKSIVFLMLASIKIPNNILLMCNICKNYTNGCV